MALSKKDLTAITEAMQQMLTDSENRTHQMMQHMLADSENRTHQMISELRTDLGFMRGILTESYVRQALIKKGSEESDRCLVQSLSDLTMLVASCIEGTIISGPRSLDVALKEKQKPSQDQLTHNYVKKLIDFIYLKNETIQNSLIRHFNVRPEFARAIFSGKGPGKTTLPEPNVGLETKLFKYIAMDKAERSYALKTRDGLGIILFTCACDTIPVHEVEFDIKPVIEKFPDMLFLKVTEVKSSTSSLSKAVSQLSQRLSILEKTAIVIFGNGVKVHKHGIVSIPAMYKEVNSDYNPDYSKLGFQLDVNYI